MEQMSAQRRGGWLDLLGSSRGHGGRILARMIARVIAACVLQVLVLVVGSPAPAYAQGTFDSVPYLNGLDTEVQFWKDIFAKYSVYQIVIHDSRRLDRVYSVLDFQDLRDEGWSDAEVGSYLNDKGREEKERIRSLLLQLHMASGDGDRETLSEEEQRLRKLFEKDTATDKFLEAADEERIRGQRGLRERFATAIRVSRRYLPEMEAIFRREGLPLELTRLPFVESCFNVKAYSKVGAAGIWQFMPGSARRYMTVGDSIDERRDPLRATEAAARYLRADYEALGSWPLALTAYNHGRAGMQRAVDSMGTTDLVTIVRDYRGPAFGFASRNFYAEFLAAVAVERSYREHFGDIEVDAPIRLEKVQLDHYVPFRSLAEAADMGIDQLAELNPALAPAVIQGRTRVPKGYELQLPSGSTSEFQARYDALPATEKLAKLPVAKVVRHKVQRGQSLAAIARRYGTSVAAIQRRNKIGKKGVRAGQVLIIPKA